MANKSRLVGTLVTLVVIGVGGTIWYVNASKPPAVSYTTVPADRGRLTAKVTATGAISALVTVQVGSQVSGTISKLFVDYNSPVKKGQVIAKIDPRLLEAALEQSSANDLAARSNVQKAQVALVDANRTLGRQKLLFGRKLIAQADLDTAQVAADSAKAQLISAQAGVEQARAQLNQAKLNLNYTTILSPIDGTVISRAIDVGQTVAASFQSPTLFTIAQDLKKEQVDAAVAESDVGKLRDHMPAEFSVAAFPNEKFKGVVRQIRYSPQTQQNVVTYDSVIDVNNSDLKLRPGMTANVTFTYADIPDALCVPNAALRFRPPLEAGQGGRHRHGQGEQGAAGGQGGQAGAHHHRGDSQDDPTRRVVYVLEDGKPHPVPVKIGLSDGSLTEIVSGDLKAGDPVITDALDPNASAGAAGGKGGGHKGLF